MYYIYRLIDPRTDSTAYVGITNDIAYRFRQHTHDPSSNRKSLWIRELLAANLLPKMEVIETVDTKEIALEREKCWVQHYVSSGVSLVNTLLLTPHPYREGLYTRTPSLFSKNFYISREAQQQLGIDASDFHNLVKAGKIRKLVAPGQAKGMYLKIQINKLAEELALKRATELEASKDKANKMVKIPKPPRNFYTASEAAQKLGMPKTTFHTYVKQGKIKRVVPPGRTEGFYPKKEIDKLVRARELFILEYASEPSTFARATEGDIKGIHDLCVSLFGITETASYETLLSWYKKNPRTYYVVKQEGIVTGYIGFLYLNEEATQHIMSETVPHVPVPPSIDVLPFTPGESIHGLWVGLAVRPGLPSTQAKLNGRHLILGGIEVLENMAREGIIVKKLYATARTSDGIKLSRKLGFQETTYPGDPLIRYELDLEKSRSLLLNEYQRLIKRDERKRGSNNS